MTFREHALASRLHFSRGVKTIDLASLARVTGGMEDTFEAGYAAGKAVTEGLLGLGMKKTACQQVGGPFLRRHGMPNAANGAEQSVRDLCGAAGIPVVTPPATPE